MFANILNILSAKAFDETIVDYKFIMISIVLAVFVTVVCCLFARSEKYKLKNKPPVVVDESYKAPTIVSVRENKD